MNPETIKQSVQAIIDGLTPLAQKLQIPIEHLWSWALKNNYAEAIFNLIMIALTIILSTAYYKLLKYGFAKSPNNNGNLETNFEQDEKFPLVVLAIVGSITLICLTLYSFLSLSETTMRLIAPEWSTMKDIAKLIK
jgi:hypothetical protein